MECYYFLKFTETYDNTLIGKNQFMKNLMAFTALLLACSSVGCSLSEKDKMMIATCESEALKFINAQDEHRHGHGTDTEFIRINGVVMETISVETNYSFKYESCYALEKKTMKRSLEDISFTETLYDGLRRKILITASCELKGEQDTCSEGGIAWGVLEGEANKDSGTSLTFEEGKKIIDSRMNSP